MSWFKCLMSCRWSRSFSDICRANPGKFPVVSCLRIHRRWCRYRIGHRQVAQGIERAKYLPGCPVGMAAARPSSAVATLNTFLMPFASWQLRHRAGGVAMFLIRHAMDGDDGSALAIGVFVVLPLTCRFMFIACSELAPACAPDGRNSSAPLAEQLALLVRNLLAEGAGRCAPCWGRCRSRYAGPTR